MAPQESAAGLKDVRMALPQDEYFPRSGLAAWLGKRQAKYPKLCDWVEQHIEETLRSSWCERKLVDSPSILVRTSPREEDCIHSSLKLTVNVK